MKQPMNYKEIYCQVCDMLKHNENVTFEAMELLCHVFGITKNDVLLAKPCEKQVEMERLLSLAKKRSEGYPLQYILGEWEFFGLPFAVGEGVLIPRADTEILVQTAIDFGKTKKESLKILDICSGSGCIAIALKKHLPWANVFALEKSPEALSYLKQNAKQNQVDIAILQEDALCPTTTETDFDIIVSNPPYLTKTDMEALQKEVSFEPSMALYGEEDGLFFYRELTRIWSDRMKQGGMLAYEIGIHQGNSVQAYLKQQGLVDICNAKDLCGIIRTVCGFAPQE